METSNRIDRAQRRFQRACHGFTLVELLVVIGIIALLVGIIFPAVTKAKRISQQAVCAGHLRQLGAAMVAYCIANEGTLPTQTAVAVLDYANPNSPPSYLRSMYKYLASNSEALVCPTAVDTLTTYSIMGISNQRSDTNYMGNGALMGMHLARIGKPVDMIWIHELSIRGNSSQLRPFFDPARPGWIYWHEAIFDPKSGGFGENCSTLHGNASGSGMIGGNVLYVDGHVQFRTYESLRSGEFALLPDQPRSNFNSTDPDGGGHFRQRW